METKKKMTGQVKIFFCCLSYVKLHKKLGPTGSQYYTFSLRGPTNEIFTKKLLEILYKFGLVGKSLSKFHSEN